MSLYRLEVFVCVAKHLHITHAADELHISQPSVSRHLKLLEDEFGVALHCNVSHGIELTPEGEEFLRHRAGGAGVAHRRHFADLDPAHRRCFLTRPRTHQSLRRDWNVMCRRRRDRHLPGLAPGERCCPS